MQPTNISLSNRKIMDDRTELRKVLKFRIANFESLLIEHLTPLLRQEIHHAIKLHRNEAIEQHDTTNQGDLMNYLTYIDTVNEKLEEHWTKLYGDFVSRAVLIRNLAFFQTFLTEKLLEDYDGQPYIATPFAISQAFLVKSVKTLSATANNSNESSDGDSKSTTNDSNQSSGGDNNSTANDSNESHNGDNDDGLDSNPIIKQYRKNVAHPLEELMLKQDIVENKLATVGVRRQYPGGDIQRLIDQCDWPNLFTALNDDRHLAFNLFQQEPIISTTFDTYTMETIMGGIDKIRDKYFAKATSSSEYTINKHAMGLSAKQASNVTDHKCPPTPTTGEHSEGSSWKSARRLYKTFADGLRGGTTSATLRSKAPPASDKASFDEKDPLIGSEKAE